MNVIISSNTPDSKPNRLMKTNSLKLDYILRSLLSFLLRRKIYGKQKQVPLSSVHVTIYHVICMIILEKQRLSVPNIMWGSLLYWTYYTWTLLLVTGEQLIWKKKFCQQSFLLKNNSVDLRQHSTQCSFQQKNNITPLHIFFIQRALLLLACTVSHSLLTVLLDATRGFVHFTLTHTSHCLLTTTTVKLWNRIVQ